MTFVSILFYVITDDSFSSLFGDPSKSSNTTSRGRAPWGGRGGGGGSGGGGGGGPRKKPMGRINNRASLNQPSKSGEWYFLSYFVLMNQL